MRERRTISATESPPTFARSKFSDGVVQNASATGVASYTRCAKYSASAAGHSSSGGPPAAWYREVSSTL